MSGFERPVPRFKKGDIVELLDDPRLEEAAKKFIGGRFTVLSDPTWSPEKKAYRYFVDGPSSSQGARAQPCEFLLRLIKPDNDANEKTSWKQFIKVTGIDPRKEPITYP